MKKCLICNEKIEGKGVKLPLDVLVNDKMVPFIICKKCFEEEENR
jgi:hypothetical protein